MKRLGCLCKNKSFWMGACFDWSLNQTWVLSKKRNKKIKNKKCLASNYFTKIPKFLPKVLPELIKKKSFSFCSN